MSRSADYLRLAEECLRFAAGIENDERLGKLLTDMAKTLTRLAAGQSPEAERSTTKLQ